MPPSRHTRRPPARPARRRRRASRRRFLARRVVALAVVVAAGYGAVRGINALVGSGESDAATTSAPADGTGATAATTTTVADTTPPTDPPPTDPPYSGPPTAEHPVTVYVAGDSDAGTFGPYLQQLLDGTGLTTVELDYKVSSGLARPDYYNWPARFAEQLPVVDPDIVVVTFGGNDAQGLTRADGSTVLGPPSTTEDNPKWTAEYAKRVGAVMDQLSEGGRTVIWVGIPNDDNPEVTARMKVQDQAVRSQLAAHPNVVFIDTWKRFSGRDGNWAEFVIDPRDGEGKDVRSDVDGFHLNETGAEILALDIAEAIKIDLRARGADI